MKQIRMSYTLDANDPGWPNSPKVTREVVTSFEKGDIFRSCNVTYYNHFGTHMDGPSHFDPYGIDITAQPMSDFVYANPLVIELPKKEEEKVTREDLQAYEDEIKKSDLLLIRTGFAKEIRATKPKVYEEHGPGVSAEACQWLVDNCKDMKAIGFDFISLNCYQDLEDGVKAHQILLGSKNWINIIEDVNLDVLGDSRLLKVYAAPIMVAGADSAPVTMWADVE